MKIGILGSGLMGGKLGTLFAKEGHEVVFSYAKTKGKLEKLAKEAGNKAKAGTPAEAAEGADALLLAVNWPRVDDVLKQAGDLSGKTIMTCSLPMDEGNSGLVLGRTTSGAEELATTGRDDPSQCRSPSWDCARYRGPGRLPRVRGPRRDDSWLH